MVEKVREIQQRAILHFYHAQLMEFWSVLMFCWIYIMCRGLCAFWYVINTD